MFNGGKKKSFSDGSHMNLKKINRSSKQNKKKIDELTNWIVLNFICQKHKLVKLSQSLVIISHCCNSFFFRKLIGKMKKRVLYAFLKYIYSTVFGIKFNI